MKGHHWDPHAEACMPNKGARSPSPRALKVENVKRWVAGDFHGYVGTCSARGSLVLAIDVENDEGDCAT